MNNGNFNMNNNYPFNESKNNNSSKDITIVILLIALISLVGYIAYDKGINKGKDMTPVENKSEQNSNDKSDKQNNSDQAKTSEPQTEIINVDKKEANDLVYWFGMTLHVALDFDYSTGRAVETNWWKPENIKYDTEFVTTDKQRATITDSYFLFYDKADVKDTIPEVDPDEQPDGTRFVSKDKYEKIFKDIWGKDVDKSTLSNAVGNYYMLGFYMPEAGPSYKFNSFTREGDNYILIIDVINDSTYLDKDIMEYPENVIMYKIKLTLQKTDSKAYTIKSMVPIRK